MVVLVRKATSGNPGLKLPEKDQSIPSFRGTDGHSHSRDQDWGRQNLSLTQLQRPNWALNSLDWSFAPRRSISHTEEFNTIEFSKALRRYATWFSFLVQVEAFALIRNPLPELGAGRILDWHEVVAKLYLVFTQLSEEVALLRVTTNCCISILKRCSQLGLFLCLCLLSPVALCAPFSVCSSSLFSWWMHGWMINLMLDDRYQGESGLDTNPKCWKS